MGRTTARETIDHYELDSSNDDPGLTEAAKETASGRPAEGTITHVCPNVNEDIHHIKIV